MKAIILNRVSTEEQKKDGNSLPAQSTRLNNHCKDRGLELILEESFDESAWKQDRKKFHEIVNIILKSKEPIALCCDKVDRLARDFSKDFLILEELRKQGRVELHLISDNIILHQNSPAADCFRYTIGISLAKYYSDSISDNVKRAYESKITRGEWVGKAPFGYKNVEIDKDKNDIFLDQARASTVEKIYTMAANGISFRKIKEEMDRMGITSNTKKRRPLTISTIEHILSNTFYYGVMRLKGEYCPHKYPPIITRALFDKVQAVRKGYHKQPFKYAAKPFIFRGLIRCAVCGCSITGETQKGQNYYSCTNYHKVHQKRLYVNEKGLLDQISGLLKRIELPDDKIKKITDGLKQINESHKTFSQETTKSLRADYDKLEDRINELTRMRLDKEIDAEFFDTNLKRLKKEQKQILEKMQNHSDKDEDYHITVNTILSLAQRAQSIFESSEVSEKRQILNLVLQNCELREKNLEYKLKTPFDTVLSANECSIELPGSDSNFKTRFLT